MKKSVNFTDPQPQNDNYKKIEEHIENLFKKFSMKFPNKATEQEIDLAITCYYEQIIKSFDQLKQDDPNFFTSNRQAIFDLICQKIDQHLPEARPRYFEFRANAIKHLLSQLDLETGKIFSDAFFDEFKQVYVIAKNEKGESIEKIDQKKMQNFIEKFQSDLSNLFLPKYYSLQDFPSPDPLSQDDQHERIFSSEFYPSAFSVDPRSSSRSLSAPRVLYRSQRTEIKSIIEDIFSEDTSIIDQSIKKLTKIHEDNPSAFLLDFEFFRNFLKEKLEDEVMNFSTEAVHEFFSRRGEGILSLLNFLGYEYDRREIDIFFERLISSSKDQKQTLLTEFNQYLESISLDSSPKHLKVSDDKDGQLQVDQPVEQSDDKFTIWGDIGDSSDLSVNQGDDKFRTWIDIGNSQNLPYQLGSKENEKGSDELSASNSLSSISLNQPEQPEFDQHLKRVEDQFERLESVLAVAQLGLDKKIEEVKYENLTRIQGAQDELKVSQDEIQTLKAQNNVLLNRISSYAHSNQIKDQMISALELANSTIQQELIRKQQDELDKRTAFVKSTTELVAQNSENLKEIESLNKALEELKLRLDQLHLDLSSHQQIDDEQSSRLNHFEDNIQELEQAIQKIVELSNQKTQELAFSLNQNQQLNQDNQSMESRLEKQLIAEQQNSKEIEKLNIENSSLKNLVKIYLSEDQKINKELPKDIEGYKKKIKKLEIFLSQYQYTSALEFCSHKLVKEELKTHRSISEEMKADQGLLESGVDKSFFGDVDNPASKDVNPLPSEFRCVLQMLNKLPLTKDPRSNIAIKRADANTQTEASMELEGEVFSADKPFNADDIDLLTPASSIASDDKQIDESGLLRASGHKYSRYLESYCVSESQEQSQNSLQSGSAGELSVEDHSPSGSPATSRGVMETDGSIAGRVAQLRNYFSGKPGAREGAV